MTCTMCYRHAFTVGMWVVLKKDRMVTFNFVEKFLLQMQTVSSAKRTVGLILLQGFGMSA